MEPNPDENNSAEETKEEGIVFLGIHMKKKATRCNLFSIFYVFFLMTTIGGYINVQIVYLLRDHGYFSIDQDHIGRVTSNILFAAIICGTCWVPVSGYLYDIFSRKAPIFTAGIIGAVLLFLCPHTAPSVMWLTFIRACM